MPVTQPDPASAPLVAVPVNPAGRITWGTLFATLAEGDVFRIDSAKAHNLQIAGYDRNIYTSIRPLGDGTTLVTVTRVADGGKNTALRRLAKLDGKQLAALVKSAGQLGWL